MLTSEVFIPGLGSISIKKAIQEDGKEKNLYNIAYNIYTVPISVNLFTIPYLLFLLARLGVTN